MAAPDQRPHHKPAMAEPAERILHAVQKLLAFAAGPKRQASPGRPFSRCRFGAAIFQKRASATLTCKAGYPAFFSIGSVLPNWPICTLLLCHPSDPFRGNRPKPALIAYNPPNGARSPTHSASLSRVSTASCMLGRAGSLLVANRSAQSHSCLGCDEWPSLVVISRSKTHHRDSEAVRSFIFAPVPPCPPADAAFQPLVTPAEAGAHATDRSRPPPG
jgi:hypothetical protein